MHAVVLLLAIVLSGYASINRHLATVNSMRLGAVDAAGLVLGQGGQVGDLQLGRLSTVVKPLAPVQEKPAAPQPITYTVGTGEDLKAIASRFGVSVDDIRGSNQQLFDTDGVAAGDTLVIPPLHGIVVTIRGTDTVDGVAAFFHGDPTAIAQLNGIANPDQLPDGAQLVIPGGKRPEMQPIKPPPPTSIPEIIQQAFAPLGPGAVTWAMRVAQCESQYNPFAVNRVSGAAGLFQFLPSTWASSPFARQSVFDPVANANAAAWLYQHAGASQWQCR